MTLSPIIYLYVCTDVLWDKSRAHDHDEVVRQHPFSSGKPISDEEARPKKKRISRGRKSDYSDDESADADSINFKDMMRSVETRHSERTKLEQERLETERENLQLARDRQAADLVNEERRVRLGEERLAFDKERKMRDEERENAKKDLIAKSIEKDHSEMIIARWEKIEKMLRSPVPLIRQRARALAEQYAKEEGFEWEADDGADE